jgi:hypothetical protein
MSRVRVCHATNNFTWVSDLANLYWTILHTVQLLSLEVSLDFWPNTLMQSLKRSGSVGIVGIRDPVTARDSFDRFDHPDQGGAT